MMLQAAAAALVPLLGLYAWLDPPAGLPPRWLAALAGAALAAAVIAASLAARHMKTVRDQLLAWNAFLRDLQRERTPPRGTEVPRNEFGHTTRRLLRLAERLARRRAVDEVLARIDEAQLIKPDRRSLVGGVLKCLEILAGGEVRAFAYFETQAEAALTVHLYVAARRRLETLRLELDAELAQRLRAVRAPATQHAAPFPEELAARLYKECGVQHYVVLPVLRAGRPWGFLVAGQRAPAALARADAPLLDAVRQRVIAGFRSAEREELLHSLAFVDRLTGLPNRETFSATLRQRLAGRAPADPGAAVLVVDIDRLKQVNDSYGRAVGDRLLVEARHRLALHLAEDDVLARLGGGEFAVFLAHAVDTRQAGAAARKMIQSMARSMLIDGHRIYCGASVGAARVPVDGTDPAELLKRAGVAMARAKAQGRHRVVFYAAGMLADSRRRSHLENDLRRALKRDELVLLYEPRLRIDGRTLCAARAHLAWQHPERGLLRAEDFLADAQAVGLAPQLGMWVLEQACRQLGCWRDAGVAPGLLACRLPAGQLARSMFAPELRRIAGATKLAAGALLLECDGADVAPASGHAAASLAAIAELCAALAVCESAGGEAPFAALVHPQVSHLRLDIGALERQAASDAAAAIVGALAGMAHALGRRVLAEGVARPEQLRELASLGCDEVQGALTGGPMPVEQFELKHFGRALGSTRAAPRAARGELPPAARPAALALEEDFEAAAPDEAHGEELAEAQLTVPVPLSEDFPLTLPAGG